MTSIDVLNNAIRMINKRGLAIGAGEDTKGRVCLASALVRSARRRETGRLDDGAYLEARAILAMHLGITSGYQALADWNDAYRTDKIGNKIHYRTQKDVVKALEGARDAALEARKEVA